VVGLVAAAVMVEDLSVLPSIFFMFSFTGRLMFDFGWIDDDGWIWKL
jgi:hypothetical protein